MRPVGAPSPSNFRGSRKKGNAGDPLAQSRNRGRLSFAVCSVIATLKCPLALHRSTRALRVLLGRQQARQGGDMSGKNPAGKNPAAKKKAPAPKRVLRSQYW